MTQVDLPRNLKEIFLDALGPTWQKHKYLESISAIAEAHVGPYTGPVTALMLEYAINRSQWMIVTERGIEDINDIFTRPSQRDFLQELQTQFYCRLGSFDDTELTAYINTYARSVSAPAVGAQTALPFQIASQLPKYEDVRACLTDNPYITILSMLTIWGSEFLLQQRDVRDVKTFL